MTPKQWIKHVRWLEKNGLAICDGSTMEPTSIWDIFLTAVAIAGVVGIGAFVQWEVGNGWKRIRKWWNRK